MGSCLVPDNDVVLFGSPNPQTRTQLEQIGEARALRSAQPQRVQ
jgi:hypothetical protein